MLYLANIFVSTFSYLYKPIGLANDHSDVLLSWAGSVAAITQGVTRLTVGTLYDHLGFRKIFFFLMGVNTVLALCAYKFRESQSIWFLLV